MTKSDTTNRYKGLIQRCEDICGLGATGITGNTTLYSQFVGWLNQWNVMAAAWAIQSWDGADFDDVGYSTAPHGTFTAVTTRDYNFDTSYKMLKIKEIQVTYDGVNWVYATPFDSADQDTYGLDGPGTKDSNIDQIFDLNHPKYDLRANGFDLYPKFTAAQITAITALLGATVPAIYVEWFRAPRDFDTSAGTDAYEPCLDLQFHHFPAVGASFEYCKLYKPEIAGVLQADLYGARTARGQVIRVGLIQEIENWYNGKQSSNARLKMSRRLKI